MTTPSDECRKIAKELVAMCPVKGGHRAGMYEDIVHALDSWGQKQFERGKIIGIGWMYTFACISLDKNREIRDILVPDILKRANKSLTYQEELKT